MKISNYERVKKWKQENPEKHREQYLKYYKNNAEVIKERKRIKYHLNKNEI